MKNKIDKILNYIRKFFSPHNKPKKSSEKKNNNMEFKFDVTDVTRIEGLSRPWNGDIPALTPIFFEIEVLVKYFHSPGYKREFASETYGTVYLPDNTKVFPFGINKNKRVVAWYVDLKKLPENEKKYLQSFNIDSDGDIDSEFYEAQIHGKFTEPIKEVEIILYKTRLSVITKQKFGFYLYNTIEHTPMDIISSCSKFKRIEFNSEDDLKRFISLWNEELIEDINIKDIKNFLSSKSVDFNNEIKQIKSLELFMIQILNDTTNMVAPLFYLYDLRIWASHTGADEKYEDTCSKMNLDVKADFKDVYNKLIFEILEFNNKLFDIIEAYSA